MGDWYELDDLIVEAAFGYSPTVTPTWTDITDYVRAIPTIRRGRQTELAAYSPGTASLVLDNRNRRFDPEHSSSPYAGDLVPMVPLRITADSYPVFYGFVQGWPQEIGKGYTDSTVTVVAVDAFRVLTQRPLAESAYWHEVVADAPIGYWPFTADRVDEINGTVMDVVGSLGATFGGASLDWYPAGAMEATGNAMMATPTLLPDAPRAIEFVINADSIPSSPSSYNVLAQNSDTDWLRAAVFAGKVQFSFSNTTMNRSMNVVSINSDIASVFVAGRTYHVVLTIEDDNTADLYVDGELIKSVTLDVGTQSLSVETQDISVSDGNRLAQVAVYDAPLTAARVTAHHDAGRWAFGGDYVERTGTRVERILDEIGWPTAWRDISTGQSELGPYTPNRAPALTYLRQMEQVEQGTLYASRDGNIVLRDRAWHINQTSAVTFADEYSTGLEFRDIYPDANTVDSIINVAAVTWSGGTVTDMDATSVAAYEASSTAVTSTAIKALFDAQDLARWLIRLGKDPRTRITRLTVLPRNNPTVLFPAILDLELGDVLTVKLTPLGVGAVTEYLLAVQGIQHRITRKEWVTDLYLAPAVASSGPYWKIGDATLGRVGAAYGNQVHY